MDGVTLNLFQLAEGVREVTVPALDGEVAATFRVERSDGDVRVTRIAGAEARFQVSPVATTPGK